MGEIESYYDTDDRRWRFIWYYCENHHTPVTSRSHKTEYMNDGEVDFEAEEDEVIIGVFSDYNYSSK